MILRQTLCAAALLALAGPALAQDIAAALSAFYNRALATEGEASAAVDASTKAFDSGDAATGCARLRDARKTYGESRVAMEGMRDLLVAGKDITADYQKQGLDWLNGNEPVVDNDMREIDRILDDRCETSAATNTNNIDTLLNSASTLMTRGLAANRDAREAFGRDDLEGACNALETARQNHSEGYQDLTEARSMVQSDHGLSPSLQRQYFDAIDRTLSESQGLADTMSDLWRNRCSSR